MENFIIVLILALIIGGVIFYLYKAKKRGDICPGCPHSKQCGSKCNCSCGDKKRKN